MMKALKYAPGKIRTKARWIMRFFLLYGLVLAGSAVAEGHLERPVLKRAFTSENPKTDFTAFQVLVLYENGGHHLAYSRAAIPFINQWARENRFSVRYLHDPSVIDSALLTKYQLFIQLDYPPYGWPEKAMHAFESFITRGKIGWLGLHHATLLGEFDGYPMWNWFSWFMGGIRFKNYVADFAAAYADVGDRKHPVMQHVNTRFLVQKEEWYTYDTIPGDDVHVLATVDESSYKPDTNIKMHAPHPVVWTNTSVNARNLYIFMGHDPVLWQNPDYKRLFWNAIFWLANRAPIHGFSGSLDETVSN